MGRLHKITLILIGWMALATANAAIVFDNGSPAQNGDGIIAGGPAAALDDFTLDNPTLLTDGHFWTIEPEGAVWDGLLIYTIWTDAGGAPGTILTGDLGINVTKTATGSTVAGMNEYLWSFDFATPFWVDQDTPYWLGLFLGPQSSLIFWEATLAEGNAHVVLNNDLDSLTNTGIELAFQLTGTPMPVGAPWALLGLGLVTMLVARRRG